MAQRKSQATIVRFISPLDRNCEANQQALIQRARHCEAYGEVPWDESTWNVTEAVQHRKRGHKANRTNEILHFTQHKQKDERVGQAFSGRFADIVKAMVRLRYLHGGQGVNSQMIFIRAWRYLWDALAAKGFDVSLLSQLEFDAAAQSAYDREGEATAYKLIGHLEEIADLLDKNRLCRLTLSWRCKVKKRPAALSDKRIEDKGHEVKSDKLPTEEMIRAVGRLFQEIKPLPAPHPDSGDRLCILIVALLALTGFRIGEALSLAAMRVKTARDGSKYLVYYQQKVSRGNVTVKKKQKVLLSETDELVEKIIDELLKLTQEQRRVARYIFEYGQPPGDWPEKEELTTVEICQAWGRPTTKNFILMLRARDIPYRVERQGSTQTCKVNRKEMLGGLLKDHYRQPVLQGDGVRIELHQALCLCFHNQMSGRAETLKHAVQPINEQHIRDFLGGRTGVVQSVFERYGVTEVDGSPLKLVSHGFRHFLNNLLDEGGAPELVQTEWFGRKHERDTRAYQHMTPEQRASQFKKDILDGRAEGPMAEKIQIIAIDKRQAYLDAKVKAVHDVGPGMCTHDFAQSPCEKHMQCSNNCDDFHWVKEDAGRVEELKRLTANAFSALSAARQAVAEEYWGADQWVVHNQQVLDNRMAQLRSMGIEAFDAEHYLTEVVPDGQGN